MSSHQGEVKGTLGQCQTHREGRMLLVRREVLYVLDVCIGIGYMLSTIGGLYSAKRDVCNLVLDICCQQLGDYIPPTGMYVI